VIEPDHDVVLASVITAIEDEIAPGCQDYAASLCRTAAQMLRQVRVRLREEVPALVAGNAELRHLLRSADPATLPDKVAATVQAAVTAEPVAVHPDLVELRADARRLRGALVAIIAVEPEDHPVRVAGRGHIAAQLRRELRCQQDAYTGPRR
jgi:hypothetical protein